MLPSLLIVNLIIPYITHSDNYELDIYFRVKEIKTEGIINDSYVATVQYRERNIKQ